MKKIILDCDPGHDDAFGIMLAAKNTDLLGVTTVGGNGPLENVTRNALVVLEQINRTDIPVYPGHKEPYTSVLETAANVHGETTLDGPVVSEPARQPETEHAVDFICRTIMTNSHVSLVATGPLTNIASAIHKQPEIVKRIDDLFIMGGGAYCGNWTPAAEYNIYVDPEAAYKVFHSGMKIHMAGVNLTRQCPVTHELIKRIRSIGNHAGTFAAELLDFFARDDDAHLHDPCAVAWAIDGSIVQDSYLHVDIELNGALTRGMTVTDLRFLQTANPEKDIDLSSTSRWDGPEIGSPFRGKEPNCHVGMRLDYPKFCDLIVNTLRAYE